MSAISFGPRIFFGGLATWFSRGMSILLGLVLMPVLFRNLSKEELGVWLLLGQSWAALGIFDLGFGVVLTRRIAFVMGKSPQNAKESLTEAALVDLSDLVGTARRVYRWLAFLSFALSFCFGALYLATLELHGVRVGCAWSAWCILCLSQAVGIWSAPWTSLLQGTGYVGWDSILSSFVNSGTLLVQIALVALGGGLVTLASAASAGALCQRWLIVGFIRRRRSEVLSRQGHWSHACFRSMLPQALRAWLTSVGYFLVANTDQFFIAAHHGTTAIPAYRAAFLLVINLHLLAGVFSGASHVFVSQLWQAGELDHIRSILKRNAQIGLFAMVCGGGAILALGPELFEVWLGGGNFVGYPVLGIFLAAFILEHHANVFSTCGRATNDEAYAIWSIIAGVLKLVLAFLLTTRLGLVGLALSTLLSQGLTNDWYMVYRSAKRLGVHFSEHFRNVLVPVVILFTTVGGLGTLLDALLRDQRPQVRVVAVSGIAAVALGGALWRVALDEEQRKQLFLRAGLNGLRKAWFIDGH